MCLFFSHTQMLYVRRGVESRTACRIKFINIVDTRSAFAYLRRMNKPIQDERDTHSIAYLYGALFVAGCTCILIALVIL